jgi:2,4-dienoyl-CoA reductase (NADPH2)
MPAGQRYPKLLSPLDPGFTRLKNRAPTGSTHSGLQEAAKGFVRQAAFFAERPRRGAGMTITRGLAPNAEASGHGVRSTPDEALQHRLIKNDARRAIDQRRGWLR